ncbi:MAG: hypothetical protein V7K41_19200 [Nostoc sp.]|uniref:hypothetical protein n=1 Tax=Nostoc sp. TaxID=1180 RepID=UPI002FF8C1CB
MSQLVSKFSYRVEWLLILLILLVQPAKAQDIPKSENRLSDRLAKTVTNTSKHITNRSCAGDGSQGKSYLFRCEGDFTDNQR